MTVRIMGGQAAVTPEISEKKEETAVIPDEKPEISFSVPERVSFAAGKRRSGLGFGNIVFVQLVLSGLAAAGIWAGMTFGSGDVREVCVRIAELLG